MLTQAWRRGARWRNDHEQVRRMTGVTEKEWRRAWPKIERFWRVDGDALVNDTQLEVYSDASARMERASRRGLSGAQARAQALLKQNSSTAQVEPEHKPPISDPRSLKEEKEKSASLSPAAPDPFTDPKTTNRAGAFLDRYEVLYRTHRNGALYARKIHRDYAAAVTLCHTWADDVRLDKLAVIFLTTDHKFAEEGSRTVPQFLALASWCDSKLAEWEPRKASA